MAQGFSSPGYEVFAEADAQGLTDSTNQQSYKINTEHKTSWSGNGERMNKEPYSI